MSFIEEFVTLMGTLMGGGGRLSGEAPMCILRAVDAVVPDARFGGDGRDLDDLCWGDLLGLLILV